MEIKRQDHACNKRLLLIGWDAADWEHITPLLEQGLLPNLERMINGGVMGNLATLQPILSPMLWNSVATGKYAHKHGIHGFVEPDHQNGGARPFSSYSRRCKALWNMFSQVGLKSNVINWWASHPAEQINGCVVTNLLNGVKFGPQGPIVGQGTIHPAEKSQFYGQFKVLSHEIESEQICAFIPKASEIVQDEDSRLQTFANTLAETLTTHAVGTAVMEHEPWDFMAIYYTAIDHFSHAFMAYHPPRMSRVPERDFEIFKDVVAGIYRFSDMMLGRLLQVADDNTYVLLCSDHGFESGANRPRYQPKEPAGPAIWHRRYGIFVMTGPGIKKDERIYGASLIDMAPTILTAMGLPVGADMDGRALVEIFEEPPEIVTIPSWEAVDGEFDSGMHAAEQPLNPAEAEDLLKQFVALGYVDDPGADKEKQFVNAEIECVYNLARNYLFDGHYLESVELMEGLVRRSPWESRFINQLIACYQRAGFIEQASELAEQAYDIRSTRSVGIRVTWLELQVALGANHEELLPLLTQSEKALNENGKLLKRIGQIYTRMARWRDAERVYRRAIELHDEDAEVWQGLSRVYVKLRKNRKAVDASLAAVSLVHRLPHAHLNLGIALSRLRDPQRAVQALQTALQFSPTFAPAHRWLARIYDKQLDNAERASYHQQMLADHDGRQRPADVATRVARRAQRRELPVVLNEQERHRLLLEERPDRADPRKPSGKMFVLVSGLPRSGTSLMMQMLEAGGLPPKTDGERTADDDNPNGYYEWEAIKQIAKKPQLLDEEGLEDKAIKVISMLLENMPYAHSYKVIFMTRPVEEVVASQAKMIDRRGTDGSGKSTTELASELARHRRKVKNFLEHNSRIEALEIDYPTLVANPDNVIPRIVEFLGPERIKNAAAMHAIVDPKLHRQRVN